jgi:hypothetical protein
MISLPCFRKVRPFRPDKSVLPVKVASMHDEDREWRTFEARIPLTFYVPGGVAVGIVEEVLRGEYESGYTGERLTVLAAPTSARSRCGPRIAGQAARSMRTSPILQPSPCSRGARAPIR